MEIYIYIYINIYIIIVYIWKYNDFFFIQNKTINLFIYLSNLYFFVVHGPSVTMTSGRVMDPQSQ